MQGQREGEIKTGQRGLEETQRKAELMDGGINERRMDEEHVDGQK